MYTNGLSISKIFFENIIIKELMNNNPTVPMDRVKQLASLKRSYDDSRDVQTKPTVPMDRVKQLAANKEKI